MITATKKDKAVFPASSVSGEITVPGDKSISHRTVIFGSISGGVTTITGFLEGEDNLRTVEIFRKMGVKIDAPERETLVIHGVGMNGLKEPKGEIYAGNSGTTARLLSGLLAAQTFTTVMGGDASLCTRPMKRVIDPLTEMGGEIGGSDGGTNLPLTIRGKKLKGIDYSSPVASAQVKSCVLLAGLYAAGETSVTEPLKSRDHTERMLKLFGADVKVRGTKVTVKQTDSLINGNLKINIPGDISSAAFFALAAIITHNSEIRINNVSINPTRTGIVDIFKRMGAELTLLNVRDELGEPVADMIVKSSFLKGIVITGPELLPAIDEFPAICVAAAFARGKTVITGAGELRVKESDRIRAMANALTAVGITVEETKDGLIINGNPDGMRGGEIESLGDHRVAMAMAVAGLASEQGVTVKDAGCVDVSFPGFFDLLRKVAGSGK